MHSNRNLACCLLLFVVLGSNQLIAQEYDWRPYIRGNEHQEGYVPVEREIDYDEIEGHPYDNETFVQGLIWMTGNDTLSRYMRMNFYEDEMEYLEDGVAKSILNPLTTKLFFVNGSVFKYARYLDSWGNRKAGYLEQVVYGECTLYKKHVVRFKEATPPRSSYEKGQPDKFIADPPEFYGVCGSTDIKELVAKKGSIVSVFGEYSTHAQKLIKEQKLKIKKEPDIIKLFQALNEGYN